MGKKSIFGLKNTVFRVVKSKTGKKPAVFGPVLDEEIRNRDVLVRFEKLGVRCIKLCENKIFGYYKNGSEFPWWYTVRWLESRVIAYIGMILLN